MSLNVVITNGKGSNVSHPARRANGGHAMTLKTCMTFKTCVPTIVLVAVLATASTASAAYYDEVINGATCTPWPSSSVYGVNHQLISMPAGGSAYCQLTMPRPWTVNYLKYVFFSAWPPGSALTGGALTARLCVHSGSSTVSCGPAATQTPGAFPYLWVTPPSPVPAYAVGAYVFFTFPSGRVWYLDYLIPYWVN